ncbi:thioredoxin [Gemmatimonas sp.]|jgi:thioredoxin 2|uniref:thioredoxin n=1 Tax=Gemmatimonas sp. TaxID=1962908 RepID=UPI00391A881F
MSATDTPARHAIVPCSSCRKLNRVNMDRTDTAAQCGSCTAPLAIDAPVVLTDGNFDTVVGKSTIPVLVDFYADWCGPCKMMAPVFADFARRQKGRVLVAKVNTDENPGVSQRFGIRSIPTLTLMSGGREVSRQVGAVPMAALERMVPPIA